MQRNSADANERSADSAGGVDGPVGSVQVGGIPTWSIAGPKGIDTEDAKRPSLFAVAKARGMARLRNRRQHLLTSTEAAPGGASAPRSGNHSLDRVDSAPSVVRVLRTSTLTGHDGDIARAEVGGGQGVSASASSPEKRSRLRELVRGQSLVKETSNGRVDIQGRGAPEDNGKLSEVLPGTPPMSAGEPKSRSASWKQVRNIPTQYKV
eukprot:1195413-Prorocentrum_minimum.AAC.4